jgi:hypothetical protein
VQPDESEDQRVFHAKAAQFATPEASPESDPNKQKYQFSFSFAAKDGPFCLDPVDNLKVLAMRDQVGVDGNGVRQPGKTVSWHWNCIVVLRDQVQVELADRLHRIPAIANRLLVNRIEIYRSPLRWSEGRKVLVSEDTAKTSRDENHRGRNLTGRNALAGPRGATVKRNAEIGHKSQS